MHIRSLRQRCPCLQLFWSVFSRIRTRMTSNTETFCVMVGISVKVTIKMLARQARFIIGSLMLSKRVCFSSLNWEQLRKKIICWPNDTCTKTNGIYRVSKVLCLTLCSLSWLKQINSLTNSFLRYGFWISKMLLGERY